MHRAHEGIKGRLLAEQRGAERTDDRADGAEGRELVGGEGAGHAGETIADRGRRAEVLERRLGEALPRRELFCLRVG